MIICLVVLCGGLVFGRQLVFSSTPTPTASLTPSLIPTDTETPTEAFTLTPSLTATETITPTLTLTITPSPTITKDPNNLTLNDSLSNNQVTLKLKIIKYEQGRTRVGNKPLAQIVFEYDFTNHSGQTIVVQLDQDKFKAEDNLGNKLTCDFWNGIVETQDTLQYPLNDQQTIDISVFCGNGKIAPGVTSYSLHITGFSSLPDSTWVAEVPH